jgi:hypothetical protein
MRPKGFNGHWTLCRVQTAASIFVWGFSPKWVLVWFYPSVTLVAWIKFYVHFRDVQGHVPCFQECFICEGNVDVIDAMRTLKEVGFSGFIIDDHVPTMVSDSNYSGRAHATGYITALVDAVMKLC